MPVRNPEVTLARPSEIHHIISPSPCGPHQRQARSWTLAGLVLHPSPDRAEPAYDSMGRVKQRALRKRSGHGGARWPGIVEQKVHIVFTDSKAPATQAYRGLVRAAKAGRGPERVRRPHFCVIAAHPVEWRELCKAPA